MAEAIKKYGANRLAIAPVNDGPVVSGTMIAVDLRPDEEVQWIWSHDPQRGSYVSGYTIVPLMGKKSQARKKVMVASEVPVTIAELERRAESHDIVLGILQTICERLKEAGGTFRDAAGSSR